MTNKIWAGGTLIFLVYLFWFGIDFYDLNLLKIILNT